MHRRGVIKFCVRRVMMQNIPGIKTTSELKEDPIAGQNQP